MITQRSGFPELDEQACISLRQRARFRPAKDSDGQFVEDTYSSSVRWILPDVAMRPVNSTLEYVLTYSAKGTVEACEIVEAFREGEPWDTERDGDLCTVMSGENTRIDPFIDDEGEPIGRKVRFRLESTVEN